MSTNYYVRIDICPHCKHPKDVVHVGKYSWGWPFLFHNHFSTGSEWIKFLKDNKNNIYDEYDRKVKLKDLLSIIEESRQFKTHYLSKQDEESAEIRDSDNYRISRFSEFS